MLDLHMAHVSGPRDPSSSLSICISGGRGFGVASQRGGRSAMNALFASLWTLLLTQELLYRRVGAASM